MQRALRRDTGGSQSDHPLALSSFPTVESSRPGLGLTTPLAWRLCLIFITGRETHSIPKEREPRMPERKASPRRWDNFPYKVWQSSTPKQGPKQCVFLGFLSERRVKAGRAYFFKNRLLPPGNNPYPAEIMSFSGKRAYVNNISFLGHQNPRAHGNNNLKLP